MLWDLSFNLIPYMLQKRQMAKLWSIEWLEVNFEKGHLMTVMQEYTAID